MRRATLDEILDKIKAGIAAHGAEAYFELAFEELARVYPAEAPKVEKFRRRLMGEAPIYWTTNDGRSIPISDMATQHIMNAHGKICEAGAGWRRLWLPLLEQELYVRSVAGTLHEKREK